MMIKDIQAALLSWYGQSKRSFPWRDIPNPYGTWVSEIMLQQTQTKTVIGYYERFMSLFPTVAALASAPEQEVLKAWEGLGYYSRARNLQKGAQQVMAEYGGQLPQSVQQLRAISGIGPYTAGAIASIAYGLPASAVDGNVIRVVSRLAGIRENVGVPSVARRIEAYADELAHCAAPGDLNQALMDLGATVCVPGTPDCTDCPLLGLCEAGQAGDAELLPVKDTNKAPKPICLGVCLITHQGRILVRQRTERMLQGLWVYCLLEDADTPDKAAKELQKIGLQAVFKVDLGPARHVFTHRVWEMRLLHFESVSGQAPAGYRYVTRAEMAALPFPTAMRKAREAAERLILFA